MKGDYKLLTDVQLADLLDQQDKAAFEEIYRRYWAVLYGFARKMLQDNEQAKDIVQDTFTKLYMQIGVLNFQQIKIAPYLYTLVRNAVITLINRDKLKINYINSFQDYVNAGEYVTDNQVLENEMQRQIDQEIASLPPKMREVFELSRKANLSRKEIAETTQLSEETVKKQIYNALKILRTKLKSYFF